MGFLRTVTVMVLLTAFFSCSPKLVVVYHDNVCHVGDGEVAGDKLNTFFSHYGNLKSHKSRSACLYREISKVRDFVYFNPVPLKSDDHQYSYAFVINRQDTLFCSPQMNFWRYGNKGVEYGSDSLYMAIVKAQH